jgi:hypothetical protein
VAGTCVGTILLTVTLTAALLATVPALPAMGLSSGGAEVATTTGMPPPPPPPAVAVARRGGARIVLYGDSLVSEAGQDFAFLAAKAGAAVRVYTFPGTSPCNFLSSMRAVATSWHPTVALLAFTGNAFTPCMDDVPVGTAAYFAAYREQTRAAISIFRATGRATGRGGASTTVVLVGQPADASARLTRNGTALNRLYQSIARTTRGVVYSDAGRAVTAQGRFTWTLPCLAGQPCTGPGRTNVVRAPDGTHFCPNGQTTSDHGLEICDVYSSGAFRFGAAVLEAALLAARDGARPVTPHR